MFKTFLILLLLVCTTSQSADAPPKPATPVKPELRSVLTDDDYVKLEALLPKFTLALKLTDMTEEAKLCGLFRDVTHKLEVDPEGWTAAEYDAKVTAFNHVTEILSKQRDMWRFHLQDGFCNATGTFIADAGDQQTFAKRWSMQAKLIEQHPTGASWDNIRLRQTLDFMSNHTVLFPDIPARIKFIDWLASVNIKTKGLNEIKADLLGTPDAPKGKSQPKQK